jgi:RHS repeat-associated protein
MAKTYFYWDPTEDNIVREYDDAGVVTAEYTTEPELYGNVISQRRQGEYRQFHYDVQGSTLAATDENQNVTDTFACSAFGEVTERGGSTAIPIQYIGQKGYYWESVLGHYIIRRRSYASQLSRWLSTDPLGALKGDANLFTYVRNSPSNATDPSGLLASTAVGVSCPGCGRASMKWRIDAEKEDVWMIVQEVCFEMSIVTCELIGGCCKGVKRDYCRECYYEHLFPYPNELPIRGIDEWELPRVIINPLKFECGQRGTARIKADIRAFKMRDGGYSMDKWTSGKGEVMCGRFRIAASDFSLNRPDWWGLHHTRIGSEMFSTWRCCNEKDAKSTMSYESTSGSQGSSDCKDPAAPP